MTIKLFVSAITKFILGVVLVAALIFIPAGSLLFFGGWLFMAVLFVPLLLTGIFMMLKNPTLLKERLDAKEKQKEQNIAVKLSGLMFVVGFIVAGLNFRFGWYTLPQTVSIIGAAIFVLGYLVYAEVLRENAYLSRTIKTQENQRVIDTGLYGIIRHPMYSATLLLFLSMPLVLGSVFAMPIFLFYLPIIATRILAEEAFLEKELDGYCEYKTRVKYRLIPFVW